MLGHVEETDTFRQVSFRFLYKLTLYITLIFFQLQDQMDVKFKKQFPTRKELEIVSSTRIWKREDKAARTIQTTWRNYIK